MNSIDIMNDISMEYNMNNTSRIINDTHGIVFDIVNGICLDSIEDSLSIIDNR